MAELSGGTGVRGSGEPIDPAAAMSGLWGPTVRPAAPPPSGAAPPTPGGPEHRLSFHGTGGDLFGIHIVNVLLTLVTLGVYYF